MNNERTLWTFGCSFTDDLYRMTCEDKKEPDSPDTTFQLYEKWKGYIPKSWPTLLSDKLNTKLRNYGKGSASNDTIYSIFMEFLY